jgi:hypothetical protein
MTVLAALVLGSTLIAVGGTETPSTAQPAVTPIQQFDSGESAAVAPDPRAARRADRIARRRRTMLKVHLIGGVALEVASTGLHALTAVGFIGADADLPPEGCAAPDMPCRGTPIVLFVPVGAMATGWIGATRLAAAREASIWRSPLFWAGTAVSIASWVVPALVVNGGDTRKDRLTVDVVLVAGLVSGTAVQMWGAFLAPPREVKVASGSLHLAPGCGPTSGGVACGLMLAGF